VKLLGMRHLGYPAVILTLIMAAASYYLVERPFMRMRDRQRPHEAAIPAVPATST
jgi:peptidoglycan/LPS O-acetylase OafA/YrhL